MSYALKDFGFGTRIYAKSEYTEHEFNNLLSCYIESGIPIIVSIESPEDVKPRIGHAILCIGHETTLSKGIS
jgi:hypothetical protein